MTSHSPPRARTPERVLAPEQAIQTFAESRQGYSRAEAVAEASRAAGIDLSAASAACPFGVDLTRLVAEVAEGDFDGALATVLAAHRWPGTMGRHCGKYCESHATPDDGGEPVALGLLERAAADHGSRSLYEVDLPPPRPGKRVAIVGMGSAGIAVAFRLRQHGHFVSMFDPLPKAGGMTLVGYPSFRLPETVVALENDLEGWGIKTHHETPIDRSLMEELIDTFDAVVICTGTHREVPLRVPGEDAQGVIPALEFLTAFKLGRPPAIGRSVAVIGAGHTAQDASRTCRRLGANATIFYRRTAEEMPVDPSKRDRFVSMLAAEGIEYVFSAAVTRIITDEDRVVGIEVAETRSVGDPGAAELTLEVVAGTQRIVACDTVIKATGVYADTDFVPSEIQRTSDQLIFVDEATYMTTLPGVFAVGTVIGTKKTVWALKTGLDAAEAVHDFLEVQDGRN
jgi:NADPH-dependent glutamate synthase beta subunit-like oxidoreductase